MLASAPEQPPATHDRLPHGTCDDGPRERRAAGGLGPPRGGAGTACLDAAAGLGAAAAAAVRPHPQPKPGIIALRPVGVGALLDGAISAIRGYPRMMLGLSAVVAAITQVLIVPVTWLLLRDSGDQAFSFDSSTTTTPEPDVTFEASAITATGVQVVVTLVASLVLTGILTVAVSRAVLGQSISARDAWNQARPRLPALLG